VSESLGGINKELLVAVAAFLLLIGLVAHAFYPRYEWKTIEIGNTVNVIVYDRWGGRFQRAVYDEKGGLNVMGAYTPSF
jgi:hypothetical protein